MSSWARVGMKVVCVDDVSQTTGRKMMVTSGHIYEISKVGIYPASRWKGMTCIWLVGVPNEEDCERAFLLSRFRPLISQSDDIAMFKALCPGLPVVPPAIVPPRVQAHQT